MTNFPTLSYLSWYPFRAESPRQAIRGSTPPSGLKEEAVRFAARIFQISRNTTYFIPLVIVRVIRAHSKFVFAQVKVARVCLRVQLVTSANLPLLGKIGSAWYVIFGLS